MGSVFRDGWEIRKLWEVCIFQNGFAFKSKTFKDEGTPVVRITNIKNEKLDLSKIVYINPTDYEKDLSKYEIKKGDLLIAMSGATTGKIGIHTTDEKLLLNQRVGKFEPKSILNKQYLFRFLSTKVKESLAISAGAAQPNLSTEQIKNFEIPLPPLQEQEKIVTILDEAFSAIKKAKANAELNLQNTKELFESYLQGIFENKGEGWEKKTLKDITTKIGSGATPRGGKTSYKEEGLSLIRSMNIHDFEFREKNLALIDDIQAKVLSNVILQKDDVLLNITGASIARCCMIPEKYLPARVNQHVSIIRANKNLITPLFLASLLTSKFYKQQILEIGEQGATRQAITKVQLENFIVIFPKTIKEQKEVINQINTLQKQTKKLEFIYQQKLQDLDELKKSILQKAFNGELVLNTELNKVIPFPIKISGISSTDLHIGIIGIAYQKHEESENLNTFGHVKVEKISHLIEYFIGIDLDRDAVKDAAGPNDFKHLNKVEYRAKMAGFFNVVKQDDGYHYQPKKGFYRIIEKTKQKLSSTQLDEINNLLNIMVKMNTKQAEVFATVFAAWNNLLIKKIDITDEKIVYEARENWHKDKLNISKDKFFIAIDWMKKNSFIPKGRGKLIVDKSFNKRG